ncbi:MAG: SNF2-related protein [Actinomycetota bacterium]
MSHEVQLTFVPGELVPAAGSLLLWETSGRYGPDELAAAAQRLDLPTGEPARLPTIAAADGHVRSWDATARRLPLLPAVRRLAALPPGSDWPAWSRPSASVLGWSVAAKLALELVAAGRVLPRFEPTEDPAQGRASWQVVAPSDSRPARLAAALPVAAHALRRSGGQVVPAEQLVRAFLDVVADVCAREGRRPELDPRRRGPRRPWPQMWAAALERSDPTVEHLRVAAEDLAAAIDEWAEPLADGDRRTHAQLLLRLDPPAEPTSTPAGDRPSAVASDEPSADWSLSLGLRSIDAPEQQVTAAEVWTRGGASVELGDRRLEDPGIVLTRGLRTAARLFPPLDRALSQAEPAELTLSAGEVAELLADGIEALTAAGIAVELPSELADAGERRLRLRARIGQSTPTGPRVEGAAPLGIEGTTDLRYEVVLGDQAISREEFAQIVALRQPLVRWRGQWVRIDEDELERIEALAGHSRSLSMTEALAAALAGRTEFDELGTVETVADGEVAQLLSHLRDADAPAEARLVDIDGQLRPYQERGTAWLQRLTDLGMGGVLADQMGLGKTLQAIALMTSRSQERPHLVVCPTSVVSTWERELHRFAPGVAVQRHHGSERATTPRAFMPGQVVITSYALLRRDSELLDRVGWDVVVFDEAQQIKNPTSKGARAARSLQARARVAMTGTPIENRLAELWSIIDVTNPGLLGSQRAFSERFAVPIERWHDAGAATRLRRLVAPFVLRRRKDDPEVAVDLPAKQELTDTCSLTREQAALYQAAVDHAFKGPGLGGSAFERRGRILALLTALKQICNHPAQYRREEGPLANRSGKLVRATEILAELVDDGDRALVFTQFREMGHLLARHLRDELELPEVPFLHGGVPLGQRDELVRRFQEDDDASPILLVSLRAGGTGLNLTRASHVVHFDRWWNPAVEDQATDRAHRIGQSRSVTVHRLVTAGTVEERIAGLLERKRSLADAVVGTGETWITELDDEELHDLVSLSTSELTDDEPVEPAMDGSQRPRLVSIPGGRA